MKQIWIKTTAAFTLAALLFSCKKETELMPSAPPSGIQSGTQEASILMPALLPRLHVIRSGAAVVDSFVFSNTGRLLKVWNPEHTTTYTYSPNQVVIERIRTNNKAPMFKYTGLLNTKGAISTLNGNEYGEEGQVINWTFKFYYDSNNRLSSMTKQHGSSPTGLGSTSFNWVGGNCVKKLEYWAGQFLYLYTNQYSAQPDKRGVWNDILDIYTERLFGERNQNLRVVEAHADSYNNTYSHKIEWTLDASQYPKQQKDFSEDGKTSFVCDYFFKK